VGALRDVGQNHLLSILTILTGELGNKLDLVSSGRKQYAGYQETVGVKSDSQTETHFKIVAKLNTDKWQNVEIILEAGKAMPEIKKEVRIEFTDGSEKVYPLELDRGSQYVAEYEQLFKDAIVGDKTRFLKREEVEAAWQFVDKVMAAWRRGDVPLEV
jgi:glucose-6-phosphate 1-dehydrogenase